MVVAGVIPGLMSEHGRDHTTTAARIGTLKATRGRAQEVSFDSRPCTVVWLGHVHGKINFPLCQFLTSHRYLRQYLNLSVRAARRKLLTYITRYLCAGCSLLFEVIC